MNDQAVAYLKNIQSSLDQLKSLPGIMERVATSNDGVAELKSIANLLEKLVASNERIERLLQKSWESYSKLDENQR